MPDGIFPPEFSFSRKKMNFAEKIDAGTLAARQKEIGSTLRVFCTEETESTNVDAAKMLRKKTPQGNFAVVANTQTAGRGRIRGRRWIAPPGNILLSCGFRPRALEPSGLSNFTLWLGLCVAKMLREKYRVPADVKWPNDIFCRGKKIAGMLTEAHTDSARVHGIVFGIGLNVNLVPAALPAGLRDTVSSLCAELQRPQLDTNRVCADLLLAIETAYTEFLAGKHSDRLVELWEKFDCLRLRPVSAVFGEEEISGIAHGINRQGCILIKDTAGTLHAFSAGDVSLKKD